MTTCTYGARRRNAGRRIHARGRRCATSAAEIPCRTYASPRPSSTRHLARPPGDQTTQPRALSSSPGRPSIDDRPRHGGPRARPAYRPATLISPSARLVAAAYRPGWLASAHHPIERPRAAACAKANEVMHDDLRAQKDITYPTRSSCIFLPARSSHMRAEVLACRVNGERSTSKTVDCHDSDLENACTTYVVATPARTRNSKARLPVLRYRRH